MLNELYKIPAGSRVLVTGATGFTGSILTHKLVDMGLDIVAIARPTSNLKPFEGMPITWLRGKVFDSELISHAMQGVSYVFHMATPFREAKSPAIVYHNVHVLSTQLLAKAAINQPKFKRFIHVSTIGIHGHIENPPADENYRTDPGDIYQETKLEGETWIRKFSQDEGLPTTIVRPAMIYGPSDKRLLKIYKWIYKGWIPVVGQGNNLVHFIHVDDLTNFFLCVAVHPKAVGETFICANNTALTFNQMISYINEVYRSQIRLIKLPKVPLFLLGDICELICRPLGVEPPIYRRRLAFYTKDRSFDSSKMHQLLDFKLKYPGEEGLKELAKWYLSAGWIS
jgi:nucleoside-diphosphate-sugar epimerase